MSRHLFQEIPIVSIVVPLIFGLTNFMVRILECSFWLTRKGTTMEIIGNCPMCVQRRVQDEAKGLLFESRGRPPFKKTANAKFQWHV